MPKSQLNVWRRERITQDRSARPRLHFDTDLPPMRLADWPVARELQGGSTHTGRIKDCNQKCVVVIKSLTTNNVMRLNPLHMSTHFKIGFC